MTEPQRQFTFLRKPPLPVKPQAPKPLAESWTVTFEPMPDAVPPIIRIRKLLKAAGRFYRLRARLAAPLPPSSTAIAEPLNADAHRGPQ